MEVPAGGRVDLVVHVVFGQFVAHVTHGEDVDARGDQRHHHEHHERQAVDVIVERKHEIAELGQRIQAARKAGADFVRGRSVRRGGGRFDLLFVGDVRQRLRGSMRLWFFDVGQRLPFRRIAPYAERGHARAKAQENARDGEIRGGLAAARRPVAGKDFDSEAGQRQQPRKRQQQFERLSGGFVKFGTHVD